PRPSPIPAHPLSLHDALPIYQAPRRAQSAVQIESDHLDIFLRAIGTPPVCKLDDVLVGSGNARHGKDLEELTLRQREAHLEVLEDRKSTRLNSSHDQISYAVF